MPDGAIRYNGNIYGGTTYTNAAGASVTGTTSSTNTALLQNPSFGPIYYLTNTDKGASQNYTIDLHRDMKDGWSVSFSYTHMHATEVQPMTSSVQSSNYNYRQALNPNNNTATTSNYEIPDKVVASVAKQFHFFNWANSTTTLSAVFRAETGHPYSWVFYGDANGDGISGNDLMYVPTGPNDPKVAWISPDPNQQTAFFSWLATQPGLEKYAGTFAPRNAFFSPWQHTVDLHLEQQIPVYRKVKVSAFVDCLNFANLLSKKWGVVTGVDWANDYTGYGRAAVGAGYNANGNNGQGQYLYYYNSTTQSYNSLENYTDLSRWMLQAGLKISF
jgi:hypothetical protein